MEVYQIFISTIFFFHQESLVRISFWEIKNRDRSLIYSDSINWNGILCKYTNEVSKKDSEGFDHCWISQNNKYKLNKSKSNKKIFTFEIHIMSN